MCLIAMFEAEDEGAAGVIIDKGGTGMGKGRWLADARGAHLRVRGCQRVGECERQAAAIT